MPPPLVYAVPRARREAESLLPRGQILEQAVAAKITAGSVCGGKDGGVVFGDDEDWVARVERRPGHIREHPRAWVVVAVERKRHKRRGVGQASLRPADESKEEEKVRDYSRDRQLLLERSEIHRERRELFARHHEIEALERQVELRKLEKVINDELAELLAGDIVKAPAPAPSETPDGYVTYRLNHATGQLEILEEGSDG